MKKLILNIWILINIFRSIPAYMVFLLLSETKKAMVVKDFERWNELVLKRKDIKSSFLNMHLLLLKYPEYRNLYYHRVKSEYFILGTLLNVFYPKLNSLFLSTPEIGGGLVIFHGFSTIIYCKKIGENCSIGQQVTVGMTKDYPTIEDNVSITAGAVVIGGITIHSNSIIGANATVTKSVPPNCVMVGNPAYIVKRNGIRVKEIL